MCQMYEGEREAIMRSETTGGKPASSGNSALLLRLEPLTRGGQIRKGDHLLLVNKRGDVQKETVREVLKPKGAEGQIREEILLRKKSNMYFITECYLAGDSWVKECQIIRAQ